MKLPKDILSDTYIKPRIFLCEVDKEKICKLETTETQCTLKFNSLSEISFETARVYNDVITGETKINQYYDKIEALRLIFVEGFGYFELQGPEIVSDGISEKKVCTAYSLEYTLSQKYIENFYVNMGTTESLEVLNATSEKDIVPITLYNPNNTKLSLLHLVLDEIYGWKIGHVDPSLRTLSRQFEVDRESVYDFLMNEVCEKFNCYIVFDTINNTINIYAESLTAKFIGDGKTSTFIVTPPFSKIGTVSVDGYKTTKWNYNIATGMLILDDIPESGAHIEIVDGALTEWETDVFISFDNLAQEVNINYDADSIKTQLTVTYGDDYDIRETNLGLPYLIDISYYYTVDWMGQDLYDAYTKYMQKSNSSQTEYANNSQEILKWNDRISYEENRLSLEYSLAKSVNSTTVGTYYVRKQNADGSYYYAKVSLPSEYLVDVDYYSNLTTNVNEEKVSNLYDVLKKYFYAHFNNEQDGKEDALKELSELLGFEFIDRYTLTKLHNDLQSATKLSQMDNAVKSFLHELWKELGRTPLKTLYLDPYKKIQQTNIEAGWSNTNSKNYGQYYPVTLFVASIESAIQERDKVIQSYNDERSVYEKANSDISDGLLMRNNFTESQLIKLSPFLREDELHIDDIVETSIDDFSSSFKIKQDAMESGRIELQKLSQPQLQFSMTMANIYAIPEFEPIIGQFQLGKVIKVVLRQDYIKQSRLLEVNINFDDLSDFSCVFGELTSLRTQSDIHADLLSNAISAGKSVATNSSYWTRGSDQATALDLKIQQGLLDATTQIKAIDGNQGVVIDRHGIKLQKKLENGELDPKQTWLVNNMILMSDDGFKTSRSALGEVTVDGETYYGLIAEMVLSGYIEGSIMKGGTIQIGQREDGTWSFEVDKDGNVSMLGGAVQFNESKNSLEEAINGVNETTATLIRTTNEIKSEVTSVKTTLNEDYSTTKETSTLIDQKIDGITIDVSSVLKDYSTTTEMNAAINLKADSITQTVSQTYATKDSISTMQSSIKQNAENIELKVSKNGIVAAINQSAEQVSIQASKIKFEGLVTANKNFKILEDGSIETKNAVISGKITATEGTIGGCEIDKDGNLQIKSINIADTLTGKSIIGGELKSTNYEKDKKGTYMNLESGDFELGNGKIYFNSSEDTLKLKNVTIDWNTTAAPEATDIIGLDDYLTQLDGKIQTYNQTTDPSTKWATSDYSKHSGDIWFNPDTGITKSWDGSSWDIIIDNSITDIAKSKAQIFTDTPKPPYNKGDLWVQGTTGDILHCISSKKENESYSVSDWKKSSKYTDDTKANAAYNLADDAKTTGNTLVTGLGFQKSELSDEYFISPSITGGYLNITTSDNKAQVVIDPNNLTLNNKILQIRSNGETVVGIDTTGNAEFKGKITATSGNIGDCEIDENGKLIVKDANITGTLSANKIVGGKLGGTDDSGNDKSVTIGGWNIGDNSLWYGTNSTMMLAPKGREKTVNGNKTNYVLYANGNFGVTTNGNLYATGAVISGEITATSGSFTGTVTADQGKVGGWNIGLVTLGSSTVVTDALYSDIHEDRNSGIQFRVAMNGYGLYVQEDSVVKSITWYNLISKLLS